MFHVILDTLHNPKLFNYTFIEVIMYTHNITLLNYFMPLSQ